MNQEQGVAVKLVTPATTRIAVRHHDEAFRHDVLFLHVLPVAHEIGTTATLDFVFINFVDVFRGEHGFVVHASIETPHAKLEVRKLLHDALNFTEQVTKHLFGHGTRAVNCDCSFDTNVFLCARQIESTGLCLA